VTIRSSSGAVVRQLGCATVTGSARVSWDGKLSTGRPASKGTYSWTLTGSDSDGALRWWSGVTKPISGTVTVA
ncbi:MAG TPA: FlgD immunoglobulin-like domain containing protein, partial [Kribbellaceae bacterium]